MVDTWNRKLGPLPACIRGYVYVVCFLLLANRMLLFWCDLGMNHACFTQSLLLSQWGNILGTEGILSKRSLGMKVDTWDQLNTLLHNLGGRGRKGQARYWNKKSETGALYIYMARKIGVNLALRSCGSRIYSPICGGKGGFFVAWMFVIESIKKVH